MKKLIRPWVALAIFVPVFAAVMLTSCKKDEPSPELPPEASFVMDFSSFQDGSGKFIDTPSSTTGTEGPNWAFAATNVAVWNIVLSITLAVPVASFVESFNHEAEWDKKSKTWTWAYDVAPGNINHHCELTAKADGDFIDWAMTIDKDGDFQNFEWYTGRSAVDGKSGQWILRDNAVARKDLLQIDWEKDGSGNVAISYTNIRPGDAGNGSYIAAAVSDPTDTFDAQYNIFNVQNDNTTNIQWHRTNKVGRVFDLNHFGDGAWHCWDETLADIDCN